MAGTEVVFTGVPAFVGAIKGPTTVGFFLDQNEFDPAKLIEVDLAKNPLQVAEAAWATDVDCDQQTTGGRTTIGPRFHGGNQVGSVYLADRLVTKYAALLASWPPPPDERYQYQAVLRAGTAGPVRYHGFKAKVVSPAKGTLAHLAFIRVGTTAPTPGSAAARWIDLADPDVCDAAANGFTTVVPSSPVGTVGAVFLSSDLVAAAGDPSYPKIPRSYGW